MGRIAGMLESCVDCWDVRILKFNQYGSDCWDVRILWFAGMLESCNSVSMGQIAGMLESCVDCWDVRIL